MDKEPTRVIHIRVPLSQYNAIKKEAERLQLPIGTVAGMILSINLSENARLQLLTDSDGE